MTNTIPATGDPADALDPGPVPGHTTPDVTITDDDRLRMLLQRVEHIHDLAIDPAVHLSSAHSQLANAIAGLARVVGEVIVITRRSAAEVTG